MDKGKLKQLAVIAEDLLAAETSEGEGPQPSSPSVGLEFWGSWLVGALGLLASLSAAPTWLALGSDRIASYVFILIAALGVFCSGAALIEGRSFPLRVVSVVGFVFAAVSIWAGVLVLVMELNLATAFQASGQI